MSEPDDRMNAAIDEVAREQTTGAPGSGFTAHVLARLDARRSDRAWWGRGWAWPPVAVAAAIVLLMMVHATWKTPLPSPAPAPQIAALPAGPTSNDQRPTTNDQRPTTNDQRPTTNDRRPTTKPSPIDAMAPEHLAVAPITIDALISVESMALSEMKVPAIDVRPLTADSGMRN